MNTDLTQIEKAPEITKYQVNIVPTLKRITALGVTNPDENQEMATLRKIVVNEQGNIKKFFDMLINPLNLYIKGLKKMRDSKLAIAAPGLSEADSKILGYKKQVQALIDQARAKKEDDERKLAEKKRQEVAALFAKEQKALKEAAEKEAKLREKGKLAQADLIKKQGEEKANDFWLKANELQSAKIESDIIVPEIPKTDGVAIKKYWYAEVETLAVLINSVIEGKIDTEAIMANMPYLNKLAREKKSASNIPGVKYLYREDTASVRTTVSNSDGSIRDALTGEIIS